MAYCSKCGHLIPEGSNYCPNCGQAVNTFQSDKFYNVYIASLGSANKLAVKELLEDVLGYTASQAQQIVNVIPAQIATGLNIQQATYVAQAFAEYGVEITVGDDNGAADLSQYARGSVYNSDGSFLAGVAATLATLSAANRVREIRRWKRPSFWNIFFRTLFTPSAPARFRRPGMFYMPSPRVMPRYNPLGNNRMGMGFSGNRGNQRARMGGPKGRR